MIEIKKVEPKQYEFWVKSESGKILLKSIPFEDKKTLAKTVESLSQIKAAPKQFERKTNFNGQFLFELKSEHGEILGKSGLYSSEAGMENGIKNLSGCLISTGK